MKLQFLLTLTLFTLLVSCANYLQVLGPGTNIDMPILNAENRKVNFVRGTDFLEYDYGGNLTVYNFSSQFTGTPKTAASLIDYDIGDGKVYFTVSFPSSDSIFGEFDSTTGPVVPPGLPYSTSNKYVIAYSNTNTVFLSGVNVTVRVIGNTATFPMGVTSFPSNVLVSDICADGTYAYLTVTYTNNSAVFLTMDTNGIVNSLELSNSHGSLISTTTNDKTICGKDFQYFVYSSVEGVSIISLADPLNPVENYLAKVGANIKFIAYDQMNNKFAIAETDKNIYVYSTSFISPVVYTTATTIAYLDSLDGHFVATGFDHFYLIKNDIENMTRYDPIDLKRIIAFDSTNQRIIYEKDNGGTYSLALIHVDDPLSIIVESNTYALPTVTKYNTRNKYGSALDTIGNRLFFTTGELGNIYSWQYGPCPSGIFGSDCNGICSCGFGNCTDGELGNGDCTCDQGFALPDCTNCESGLFGSSCDPCTCVNGVCNDGNSGNGTCLSCNPGYDGDNCDECAPNYFGLSCTQCTCVNGTCADTKTGDGECSCFPGWDGDNCDVEVTGVPTDGSSSTSSSKSVSTKTDSSTQSPAMILEVTILLCLFFVTLI